MPIGVAVVLMTLQTLRGRETRTERRRIDAVGLALLVIGIGSLQIMLDRGKELDWFSSQEIIILYRGGGGGYLLPDCLGADRR